jgi:hypothetical protein
MRKTADAEDFIISVETFLYGMRVSDKAAQ